MDRLVRPTREQFDRLAFEVTNQMRDYTFPYVASISGETEPNVAEHPKKLVVYDRAHPEIRLVLLLDSAYDRDGESWQPIMQSRVERDRGIDPEQSRAIEQRIRDEVCQVERRGRPRGTGHPKRHRLLDFPIAAKDIYRLRKAGLDDTSAQQGITLRAHSARERFKKLLFVGRRQRRPRYIGHHVAGPVDQSDVCRLHQ